MTGKILVFLLTYFLILVRPWKFIEVTGALAGIMWLETAKTENWSTSMVEFVKKPG